MEISNTTFSSAIVNAINYNSWIISKFEKYISGSLLEVGIGHGEFYKPLSNLVSNYTGIDIDPKLLQHAKQCNPNATYYRGDITLSGLSNNISNNKFDTVMCFNVIEHIENDQLALNNLIDKCNPGGHVIIFLPAFNYLYNDLDSLAGHYRRYNKKMVMSLVDQIDDVEVCKLEYFNSVGGLGWYLNKFTTHDCLEANKCEKQIQLFDRFFIHFSKAINPLFKYFFGQSLILVLKNSI